jgi:hypothetical protein
MITFEEALAIQSRISRQPGSYPKGLAQDRGDYWFFPHPPPIDPRDMILGSQGMVVDKADGHRHSLGSAFSTEEWFLIHEQGLKHHAYTMVIDEVFDRAATTAFLRDGVIKMDVSEPYPLWQSANPPELPSTTPFVAFEHVRLWRYTRELLENERRRWFRYHLIVRECHDTNCQHIGRLARPAS